MALGRGRLPEVPERKLIGPLLRPGMVFVDIGANIGTYSLFVAEQCRDNARIVSFEPHPRTFEKLGFNIRANGYSSIEPINEGVGSESGQLHLHTSGGTNIGTASILEEAIDSKHQVEIKVAPLCDALASRHIERVDLLKIDIEGFEDRALMPLMAEENRPLWPAAILIETVLRQHWQVDCVSELTARGYSIAGDTGENLLLLHPMTEKLES
ncbi:MAG: FkbM family methyltransferase [Pseudomonadota bacterium]